MKAIAICPKCGKKLETKCDECIKHKIDVHQCKSKNYGPVEGIKWKIIEKGPDEKIKFCPKCKSTNVNIKADLSEALKGILKWRCNNCGLEKSNFPEMKKKIKKIKDKKKR